MTKRLVPVIVFGLALTVAGNAGAAADPTCAQQGTGTPPSCATLNNPIYISGSTALEPLYKALGPVLASGANAEPIRNLVYLKGGTEGSCSGVRRMAKATPDQIGGGGLVAQRVDSTGAVCTCTIDTPVDVTVGISDVWAQTCDVTTADLTAGGLQDFTGPVNAMSFVAPANASVKAISFEQAFLLFGFGSMYNVTPWTNPAAIYVRPEFSGTLRMLGAYLGILATKWQGIAVNAQNKPAGSGDVYAAITSAATSLDQYIGILGQDYLLSQFDKTPGDAQKIKTLAFRGAKQRYAWYPDSTPTGAKDKRNVRDGHYLPWGPVHLFAKVSGATPVDAGAARLIGLVQNESDTATLDTVIKKVHLTPVCAMRVTRDVDGGDLRPFTPANACDCYFEKAVGATVPSSCVACDTTTPCATGTCRRGVCETR